MYTLVWYCLSGFVIVLILFYWAFLVQGKYLSLYPDEIEQTPEDDKKDAKSDKKN
jgi:hypothetical protein